MADVFISYSRQDRHAAERVARRLENEGWSVWWDQDLVAGEAWAESIRVELKAARAVVVLWSTASWASRWVQAEAHDGHGRNILASARLDDVVLEAPFNIIQAADLRQNIGRDALVEGVRRILASSPDTASVAPAQVHWRRGRIWSTWRQPILWVGGTFAAVALGVSTSVLLPSLQHSGSTPTAAQRSLTERAMPFVAVLPFDNLSGAADAQYFSDGLSEEILNALMRIKQIRVAARNSSFTLRGGKKSEAAVILGVTHVLDGSIRREGPRVRVSAHLIDARKGTTIWSQDYDRELAQSLALQDEIAERVADALDIRLSANERKLALNTDPQAYDHYLRGRELFRARGKSLKPAVEELEEAVRLAPDLGRAWSTLAAARMFLAESGAVDNELIEASRDAVNRAINLDPKFGETLALKAKLTPMFGHLNEIDALFEQAVAADPANAQVLNWRAIFLGLMGRDQERLRDLEHAYKSDPLTTAVSVNYAGQLMRLGRPEAAKVVIERRRASWMNPWYELQMECNGIWINEDWLALEELVSAPPKKLLPDQVQIAALIGKTAHALRTHRTSEYPKLSVRWKDAFAERGYLSEAIWFLVSLGDTIAAVELLEKHLVPPTPGQVDPYGVAPPHFMLLFSVPALTREPQIVKLMHEWGLFEYWRTSGHWPDFCADPNLPYNCEVEANKALVDRLPAGQVPPSP